MSEKMLVTQALSELKTLDSRIRKKACETEYATYAKVSESKVSSVCTKTDFLKNAESGLASAIALITRREAIKAAVIASNATTMVEVCGEKMPVAKAIDLKESIKYRKFLCERVENQYQEALRSVNMRNEAMEQRIDNLISTAYGRESKTSIKQEDYDAIAKPYRAANECGVVAFRDIEKYIENEKEYIEKFSATIDQVLQISDCITYIEI